MTPHAQQTKAWFDRELTRLGWQIKSSQMIADPIAGWDSPWYRVTTTSGNYAEAPDAAAVHRQLQDNEAYAERYA